jgi:hypothetical protein
MGFEADAAGVGIPVYDISIRYWTGSSYSGTGLVPASVLFFIPVPE